METTKIVVHLGDTGETVEIDSVAGEDPRVTIQREFDKELAIYSNKTK